MAKIPSINIVLNIGGQKPIGPKSKPPTKKGKKKEKDEKKLLLKSLEGIRASIENLPHTGHSGGA
jgi:hypothetical protein